MRNASIILLLFLSTSLLGQTAPDKYWIQFTDKNNSPYSITAPHEFLSYRAIDRRNRFQIQVTEQDLPVNPDYVHQVINTGVELIHCSRWFNGISIHTADTNLLEIIKAFEFVRSVKAVKALKNSLPDKINVQIENTQFGSFKTDSSYYDYGQGSGQIGMINGHILHNQGFQGQGMVIAILDGGFTSVNINPAYDSLWQNNQILGGWDFVEGTPIQYQAHSHGSYVLSTMGANIPGIFIGTAPKASFYLIRTEKGASEFPLEEDHWVAGAEYADSVGADLINSSLSYTVYWEPFEDHTYNDMDGNTTRVTQAADIAASKGILVVTSAGNEGKNDWHYIGAPADADSVLTVGAVNAAGEYAAFSSTGPTADGRVKPNISAMGESTFLVGNSGSVFTGNGTSFSTPIVCGMAACLWQSNKYVSNIEIIKAIEQSASQANQPDSLLGFGIPDFSQAFFVIQGIDSIEIGEENIIRTFPNPFTHHLNVDYYNENPSPFDLVILDLGGRKVYQQSYTPGYTNFLRLRLTDLNDLESGIYFLQVTSQTGQHTRRIVKTNN